MCVDLSVEIGSDEHGMRVSYIITSFFTVSETLMTSDIGVIKFTVLSDGHLITKCYVFFRFSQVEVASVNTMGQPCHRSKRETTAPKSSPKVNLFFIRTLFGEH